MTIDLYKKRKLYLVTRNGILLLLAPIFFLSANLQSAQTLIVTLNTDTNSTATTGTDFGSFINVSSMDLRAAINYMNSTTVSTPPFTVIFQLPAGMETITLTAPLPVININAITTVTIDGSNNTGVGSSTPVTISGNNLYRGFFIRQANTANPVTIQNLTFLNCVATGGTGGSAGGGGMGAGGGLFVDSGCVQTSSVILSNVGFTTCSAVGGTGGAVGIGGGGGGWYGRCRGGNGGIEEGAGSPGGGGGGLFGAGGAGGNGGAADSGGGGGGGGALGVGGSGGAGTVGGNGQGGCGGGGGVTKAAIGGAGGSSLMNGTTGGSSGTLNGKVLGGGGGGGCGAGAGTGGSGGGSGGAQGGGWRWRWRFNRSYWNSRLRRKWWRRKFWRRGEEVVGEEEFSRVAQGVMEAEAEDRLEQPEGSGAMVAVEEELLH